MNTADAKGSAIGWFSFVLGLIEHAVVHEITDFKVDVDAFLVGAKEAVIDFGLSYLLQGYNISNKGDIKVHVTAKN